jgi:Cof subfamily protein (haloacid dehalogenase superfamily)
MPVKFIALDLDGTLLNSRQEISPKNCAALEAAAARGIGLLITTGRRLHSALPLLALLRCPLTIAASNGALVATAAGEVLYRDFLPRPVAARILEAGIHYRPYAVAIFDTPGKGQVMMQLGASPQGPFGWYLRTAPECLVQVEDLAAALPRDPIQVMFGGPPAHLEPLGDVLHASPASEDVQLTWTKYLTRDISLLDVMNRGCSKASALHWWLGLAGGTPEEAMAIGDNFNDLEILQMAGFPVVMANASAGLNRDGWHVTLSNDEDGVATAIQAFALE